MCWFQGGVSKSAGRPEAAGGLGLLPGSLSVHRDGEPERLPVYLEAVATGALPSGYAADDGSALVFAGRTLVECVASRPGARVARVSAAPGGTRVEPLAVRLLPGAAPERAPLAAAPDDEGAAVAELRELRAAGRRWG